MPRPDMSPAAVTARLVRTAQLRRLCLLLGRGAPAAARHGPTVAPAGRPAAPAPRRRRP